MAIAQRLQEIISSTGLSNTAFADKIGVQRSSISHVLAGRNKPSVDFIQKILNTFESVDALWLVTGVESEQKVVYVESASNVDVSKDIGVVEDEDPVSYGEVEVKETLLDSPDTQSKPVGIKRIVVYYTDGTYVETYPND